MKHSTYFLFITFISINTLFSQNKSTISIVKNYNDWNWETVYVAKNKFISLAVVPEAAGRILEYNLGNVKSLWVNPKLFGKSFPPNEFVKMNEWRNFGGYRLVPTPINNCAIDLQGNKTKRWPPPAVIGDNPYEVHISKNEEGQETIVVNSGIQNLPVPLFDTKSKTFSQPNKIDEQLQYSRSLHIEDNSSLVYINHNLTNKGSQTIKRGIMTSSQHISRSEPHLEDGENFLAYVPFSPEVKLPNGEQFEISTKPEWRWRYVNNNRKKLDKNNPEHVKAYFNTGTNWNGEVAKGIFEIEYDYYLMAGFHIISSENWICYVNKLTNTAFGKILEPYDASLQYEDGINVAVYNSGMETGYLETEVKTPLYTLTPGSSFNYKEIQGATQITDTPVLAVNLAGIITKRLSLDKETNNIRGNYGVFHEGKAFLKIYQTSTETFSEIEISNVNPLKAFTLDYDLKEARDISNIELIIRSSKREDWLLDSL